MEDEIKDDIITPENNDEKEELDIDIEEDGEPEKKIETPEAKQARLKRMLAQHEKKFNLIDGEPSKKKPEEKTENKDDNDLSQSDVISLVRANIEDDDIEYVKRYAKLENITVSEALKKPELKSLLSVRVETRATAEALNVKPSRKGAETVTSETLLKNLSEGKVPEPGSKEAEDLFWAKRGGKR
jgi:hypothetical protein